jgi:hypothetical protein
MNGGNSVAGAVPIEEYLSARDPVIGKLILGSAASWSVEPTEDPIWGLVRIVLAQQVSTSVANLRARKALLLAPELSAGHLGSSTSALGIFAKIGATGRQATCCARILATADLIRSAVNRSTPDDPSFRIPGIGPWTMAVFRILILKETDIIPENDVGLLRAFCSSYGPTASLSKRAMAWRPYRSVAVWHLWRSLGNEPLG